MTTDVDISLLSNLPAMAPPAGVVPNLVNPENQNVICYVALTICIFVTTLAVMARSYTKAYIVRKMEWEDYASLAAWALFAGSTGLLFISVKYGIGVHQWNVSVTNAIEISHMVNIIEILYAVTIFIAKLSILLQYLRILVPSGKGNPVAFYAIHLVIGANFIYYIICTFIQIFACTPREFIWNPFIKEGHCLQTDANGLSSCAINIVSDFSILLLPLRIIWKLQMPIKRKFGISAVFALGLLGCIASVVRLIYTARYVGYSDITYISFDVGIWTYLEVVVAILCGCLPILPKFFRHFRSQPPSESPAPLPEAPMRRFIKKAVEFTLLAPTTGKSNTLSVNNDSHGTQHALRSNQGEHGTKVFEDENEVADGHTEDTAPSSPVSTNYLNGYEWCVKLRDLENQLRREG